MSHPSRTKTQGGDRFSRNRPFSAQGRNLWAGLSDSPAQKLLARSWTGPENFINILSFHQKLFNFLIRTDRQTQTDRHTDTRTPIHIRAGEIFLCLFLIHFHFTTFALLTPFVKDKRRLKENIGTTLAKLGLQALLYL
jgi:hypothetical protein